MSSGLGEITTRAHQLVADGDLDGARELLDPALAATDLHPAYATMELAEAAGLQARVLAALGEPHTARAWAALAYSATKRLHGSSNERTIAASAALAAVLHQVGSYARSAHLYREVIDGLTASDGPTSLRVLAAQADLATVEHARGDCTAARERLAQTWARHREAYGEGQLAGLKMLARLGAMERDCGLATAAHDHFALATRLCREHLPTDHRLAQQIATLAHATANPAHPCATRPPTTPPEPTPEAATASGTNNPADDEWPGVQRVPPQPDLRSRQVTPRPDDPPGSPHTERRRRPLALTGLLIALLATVAVVAGLTLAARTQPHGESPPTTPPTTGTAPGASVPSELPAPIVGPPTELALQDTRDAVTLAWTYPDGAEGPVVVSVGRIGQPARAFEELPPGTDSFVAYGLNPNTDYCFSVAIVYAPDQISRSEVICTTRIRASSRG